MQDVLSAQEPEAIQSTLPSNSQIADSTVDSKNIYYSGNCL